MKFQDIECWDCDGIDERGQGHCFEYWNLQLWVFSGLARTKADYTI